MTAVITLSCPNGGLELEFSGNHDMQNDIKYLESVAVAPLPHECPGCGSEVERK